MAFRQVRRNAAIAAAAAAFVIAFTAVPKLLSAQTLQEALSARNSKQKIELLTNFIASSNVPIEEYCEALKQRGIAYAQKKDWDAAIADLLQVAEIDKADPIAHYNLGVLFLMAGQYDAAITKFDKALALDPELAAAYYNRGVAKVIKGNEAKKTDYSAIPDLEAAGRLDPVSFALATEKAFAYFDGGYEPSPSGFMLK